MMDSAGIEARTKDPAMRSRHVRVQVSLDTIRANAERIRSRIGGAVKLMAMIKTDAYGHGAGPAADALAAVVDDFCYFSLDEAQEVGRPGLVTGPVDGTPDEYAAIGARAAISNLETARRFRGRRVCLHLDLGMQRFGFPPEQIDEFIAICGGQEAFGHAATLAQVQRLMQAATGRVECYHAAASSLLEEPRAWLHAVRPGVALYRGAARVTTRLHSVRETSGPVGYTGFEFQRLGIILAGYGNLLRQAPVIINGRRQHTLEIGMNTAFVTVGPEDRAGDEVVLLGDDLSAAELSTHLQCREHEVMTRYCAMGVRTW